MAEKEYKVVHRLEGQKRLAKLIRLIMAEHLR